MKKNKRNMQISICSAFPQSSVIKIYIIYLMNVCGNSLIGYFSGAGFAPSAILLEMIL